MFSTLVAAVATRMGISTGSPPRSPAAAFCCESSSSSQGSREILNETNSLCFATNCDDSPDASALARSAL